VIETKARRAVRSTTQVALSLKPVDAERFRTSAKHYGMSLAAYLVALVNGEQRVSFPSSHARIGACIVGAIAELQRPTPNPAGAIVLLREAQGLGVDFARNFLPAFDAMHTLDGSWDSPDRPERR
jgi:hypothetical protein